METKKQQRLTKCNFCAHWTRSGCTVIPNQYNCRDANNEFYAYLASLKKNKK